MDPNTKIFCIGLNKTGTTSLGQALADLGYKLADQQYAALKIDAWASRDFRWLPGFCATADAFQDIPFSLPFTFQICDHLFPNAKFILTMRNDADQWYQSLLEFHAKILGTELPITYAAVESATMHRKGWMLQSHKYIYGVGNDNLYDENIYKRFYENHNTTVLEYFRYRPKDLLVINLASNTAMKHLCSFLGIQYSGERMPHLNRTA